MTEESGGAWLVRAMEIVPFPLVMATPDPAVRVALARVLPVDLPIKSCPSVYEV